MKKYPWELGVKLAEQIKTRNHADAEETALKMLELLFVSGESSFAEKKMRMLQNLTIASRAAFTNSKNLNDLLNINLDLVRKIVSLKSRKQLENITRQVIKNLIDNVGPYDSFDYKRVKIAVNYMKEHYTDNITRKQVAKILGCSSSHLSRLFTETTGRTFKEYILMIKMDKAKVLLADSRKNISELAYEVGYKDPNYFVTTFKRIIGVTPSEYRKKLKK